jgi:two-component sensor histidine kinase
VSERKRTEERIQLLMAEVNHRSKNLLAVVQAVVHQTAKHGDPATFAERLSDRIVGLAASQDLLVENNWQGVEIADLVEVQLAHFKDLFGTRILVDGLPARLTMGAAQGIGMALHELATNAAKYGALSNADGQVRITWQTTAVAEPNFSMSWLEVGGPKPAAPTQKGFGQVVIGRMAEAAVDGIVEIEFCETGISWRLSAPVKNTLASAGRTLDEAE